MEGTQGWVKNAEERTGRAGGMEDVKCKSIIDYLSNLGSK